MGATVILFASFGFRPSAFTYVFTGGSGRFWFSLHSAQAFFTARENAGITIALLVSLLVYVTARRSRYFGNTSPLLIALLLLPLYTTQVVTAPWLWALPFLFTFIGGVFADVLESSPAQALPGPHHRPHRHPGRALHRIHRRCAVAPNIASPPTFCVLPQSPHPAPLQPNPHHIDQHCPTEALKNRMQDLFKNARSSSARTAALLTLAALTLLPLTGCRGGVRGLMARFHHRKSKSKPNTTDYASNVQDAVSQARLAVLKNPDFSQYQQQVQGFYDDRNYELAWTRDGSPTPAAVALITLFNNAAEKGLRPEDYDASLWSQRQQALADIHKSNDTSDNAQTTVAQFDAALTIAAMRYASDLHEGRVNPQTLNFDIDVPAKRAAFDLAGFLNDQLVDADDVPSAIAGIEPKNPMYKATEDALAKYISLAKQQDAQPARAAPRRNQTGQHRRQLPRSPAAPRPASDGRRRPGFRSRHGRAVELQR